MEPAAARTDDDAVPTAELFVSLAPDDEEAEAAPPTERPPRTRALWLVLVALAIVPAVIVLARLFPPLTSYATPSKLAPTRT